MSFSFRTTWYALLVWIIAFLISGTIVVPMYFIVMPLVVLMLTVYYFDTAQLKKVKAKDRDLFIKYGIVGALFWFLVAGILSFVEMAGFYYLNVGFYLSDFKNLFLFPVILLTPVLYGIVLSNKMFRRKRKKRHQFLKAPAF